MLNVVLASIDIGTMIGIGGLILALASILVTVLLAVQSRQSKVLTYEKLSDTAIIDNSKDLGQGVQILMDGHEVRYMRLVNLKIASAGNAMIDQQDYLSIQSDPSTQKLIPGLWLDFGEHRVVRYAIHSTEPNNLFPRNILNNLLQEESDDNHRLFLQGVALNQRNALFVKVFCLRSLPQGMTDADYARLPDKQREVKVSIIGQIKECPIKEYVPAPPRLTRGRIGIAVSVLLAILFFFTGFFGLGVENIVQGHCGVGSIQDSGSTAFYSTVSSLAQSYHGDCVLGNVAVSQSNSSEGLADLQNGQIQIANSELFAQDASVKYTDLQDHQVAAIIFALIVNKDVQGVNSLTGDQIRGIYDGSIHYWSQINADQDPKLSITVIERPRGSGTLAALSKYLLNGQYPSSTQIKNIDDRTQDVINSVAATPGAIGYVALSDARAVANAITILNIDGQVPGATSVETGLYHFWAIEHMYTQPDPDLLVSSFINFVKENTQTGSSLIRVSDVSPALLQTRL